MDIKDFKVSKDLVTFLNPVSPASEAYNTLRTNIQYSSIDKKLKTIIITSPDKEDGKTVTICNLAVSIANTGRSVLLIDADLRKPRIHKVFKLLNNTGLTDVLVENTTLEKALNQIIDIPNLQVLTSGTIPPNPSELLASKKIKDLIAELAQRFDVILIDTPPVCYVSDSLMLSGIADGVILAIAAKKTKISDANNAKNALKKVDANLLGVVMTKIKDRKNSYYYKY